MHGPDDPPGGGPNNTRSGQIVALATAVVVILMDEVPPDAGRRGVMSGAVLQALSASHKSPVCVTTWGVATVNSFPVTYGNTAPAMWSESADEKRTSTLSWVAELEKIVPATPPPNFTLAVAGSYLTSPRALRATEPPPFSCLPPIVLSTT